MGGCDAWDAFAAEKHVHIDTAVDGVPVAARDAGPVWSRSSTTCLNDALEVAPARGRGGDAHRASGASGSSWRVSDEGPGDQPRGTAATRSSDSGSRVPQHGAMANPTGTSVSASPSCTGLVRGDGGDVALEPCASGGLEVIVRMKRCDDVLTLTPHVELSTASAT